MSNEQERLSSLDAWGHRVMIIPAEVAGFFHKKREQLRWVLIFVFLLLPWTKINGLQTILINIPKREFSFFGVMFWAHDGPLLFFLLAFLTVGLALVTAIWGRVWCGWGCPQTVFIEGVYRKIERVVEGNYIERRKLRDAVLSVNKAKKYVIKWALYFVVSFIIAHSALAYFVGSSELLKMMGGSPDENWFYFLLVMAMTGLLMFNFGWFREQFCIIMCPYGRFQSVLMDSRSLAVVYDDKRGEPRKGLVQPGQSVGDCVSCNRCVNVCPTGIDIRKGLQMECIACTACIDACDEIMTKIKKPMGLIRYDSVRGGKVNFFRPRTIMYLFVLLFSVTGLAYNFTHRDSFFVFLVRATDTPYQLIQDGSENKIINHFKLHIHNQTFHDEVYEFQVPSEFENMGIRLTLQSHVFEVPAGQEKTYHFFVLFPVSLVSGTGVKKLSVKVAEKHTQHALDKAFTLVGPK